jgi:pectinesterase
MYSTIDFIFGDAAVVLQNSIIYVRLPLEKQSNVITADGRYSRRRIDTAIVIHNCTINATPELEKNKSAARTHLGRPWKKYFGTVIMESYLGDITDSKDWTKYKGSSALKKYIFR